MLEIKLTIKNKLGLHARPSALLAKTAGLFRSAITLTCGKRTVDAKSILGLMTMAFPCGTELTLSVLAGIEKLILVVSTILILVLTVGNVFSRKVIHQSWSFTEELVVAVFVLITLLAAALACREGELVNLTLLTDRLPAQVRKVFLLLSTILSVAFTAVLFKYGLDKVITQMQNGKRTFVLNWPEWIFWSFVPIGGSAPA